MSSDRLLNSLRRGPQGTTTQKYGPYGTSKTSTNSKNTKQQAPGQVVKYQRQADGDRPIAGPEKGPTSMQSERDEITLGDILVDLGLRAVEMMIAAAAQEVVYYFSKRRLYPKKRADE